MIPAVFTELASLPLTPSGKLDRAALPAPGPAARNWRRLRAAADRDRGGAGRDLGRRSWAWSGSGPSDNFFELGGHSLLATRVISRIKGVFGADIPLAAVFDYPTVAGLAAVIEETTAGVAVPPVEPVSRDQRLPLSFAQQRLWFLDQLDPESAEYNVPSPRCCWARLDVAALGAALSALIGPA